MKLGARLAVLAATLTLGAAAASAEEKPAAAGDIPPMIQKLPKFDKSVFDPVDGMSVRDYAHLVLEMFLDDSKDNTKLLSAHNLTKPQFDHINDVMIERMRKDTSFKFIEVYGAYYIENAEGPFKAYAKDVANSVLNGVPLKEKDPMSWEEYLKLQGFYGRKAPFAKDTSRASYDEILAEKAMTFMDYQILGAWFGRKLALQH
jgi:hypothetical protein